MFSPTKGRLPFYSSPFKTFWYLEFIKSRLSIPLSLSGKKKSNELAMQGLWLSSDSSLVAPVVSAVPAGTQDTPVWTVSGP